MPKKHFRKHSELNDEQPAIVIWRSYHQSSYVNALVFSPDGATLASGGEDGVIRLWKPYSHQQTKWLAGHTGAINSIAFSPDGQMLVSGAVDDTVRFWNVASGRALGIVKMNSTLVECVAFSPDGKTVAAGSNDGGVRLMKLYSSKFSAIPAHRGSVNSLSFSPDGQCLISAGDGTIRVWNVASGQALRILKETCNGLNTVTISPGGRTLASGAQDSSINLRDLVTGEHRVLTDYFSHVPQVAFSPDGNTLASAKPGILQLWEVASGNTQLVADARHTGRALVAFSPDGLTLASGSWNGSIYLWDLARLPTATTCTTKRSSST